MSKRILTLAGLFFAFFCGGMEKSSKIFVAGHNGLVGSAIVRKLTKEGYTNLIVRSHKELDLSNQQAVYDFFAQEKPEYVFLSAAKVGGIKANNTYRADFIYTNLMIEANVISAAHKCQTKKLLFLGSSCIYPRNCTQPIKEEYLLTGILEPTNEPYAIAKIAGISLCQSFKDQYGMNCISCMPTNLYGPGDNFNRETSHVLPALIAKIYEAKVKGYPTVTLWGSGRPRREFLHVDDLADACLFLMNNYNGDEALNVGTGMDISILEVATMIKEIIGYTGEFIFDASQPDGTPRKLLDVSKLEAVGWKAQIPLYEGLKDTIEWYCKSL